MQHPCEAAFGIALRPDPVERAGQIGRVCGIAAILALIPLLRQAERDDTAPARALDVVDALPSLTRRRLISSFAATQWVQPKRGECAS
jgi:hypothetical protein